MKKQLFLMPLMALALASCASNDEPATPTMPDASEEHPKYLAINLTQSEAVTRATETEPGSRDENSIDHIDFFFFDASGNPVSVDGTTNRVSLSHEYIKNSTPVIKFTGHVPDKVLALVNEPTVSDGLQDLYDNQPVSIFQEYDFSWDNGGYFIMANAVYKNASGEWIDATPISADNVADTEDAAKSKAVTINVERLAAKVTLTMPEMQEGNGSGYLDSDVHKYIPIDGFTLDGGQQIVFVPVKWGILRDTGGASYLKSPLTQTDNLGFDPFDIDGKRYLWSDGSIAREGANASEKINDMINISDRTYTYVGENTSSSKPTSVVVAGYYATTSSLDFGLPGGLACYKGKWYTGSEMKQIVADETGLSYNNNALSCFSFIPDQESGLFHFEVDETELANSSEAVRNDVAKLKLHMTTTAPFRYFDASGDNPLINDKVQAYYYAKIPHMGSKGSVGEFGVVRNFCYKLTITKFVGIGNANTGGPAHDWSDDSSSDKVNMIGLNVRSMPWSISTSSIEMTN